MEMRQLYKERPADGKRTALTPDEVRMLDNQYALLFIRGERPVKDFKFDILKHPNISLTEDGKGKPYIHGDTSGVAFTIELTNQPLPEDNEKVIETGYVLLSEEDVEKSFKD